jgi:hypothetical protein
MAKAPNRHVAGDPSVVAHPAFRDVPECLIPLDTEKGQAEYDMLVGLLYHAGRLNADTHRALSAYAAQFDTIILRKQRGEALRASAFTNLSKERKKLGLDELDKPIAAPEGARVNRYARCGFANRGRQALLTG